MRAASSERIAAEIGATRFCELDGRGHAASLAGKFETMFADRPRGRESAFG